MILIKLEDFLNIILCKNCQKIEEAMLQIQTSFNPITAVGKQLDVCGELAGAPTRSLNQTDDDYKLDIFTQIIINNSTGIESDIYAALDIVTNDLDSYFNEVYPRAVDLYADLDTSRFNAEKVVNILNKCFLGGITISVFRPRTYDSKVLCLSGPFGEVLDNSGTLWDEVDSTNAGKLTINY